MQEHPWDSDRHVLDFVELPHDPQVSVQGVGALQTLQIPPTTQHGVGFCAYKARGLGGGGEGKG